MTEIAIPEAHTQIAAGLQKLIQSRTEELELVEVLSDRDHMIELMQEPGGEKVVRRTYDSSSMDGLKATSFLDFAAAWTETMGLYSEAGLVVPRGMVVEDTPDQAVVITEFIDIAGKSSLATLEEKQAVATALGKLIVFAKDYIPHLQLYTDDNFVVDPDGRIVMVDVDPALQYRERSLPDAENTDYWQALHIKDAAELLMSWARPGEARPLVYAYCAEIGDLIGPNFPNTLMAFAEARTTAAFRS